MNPGDVYPITLRQAFLFYYSNMLRRRDGHLEKRMLQGGKSVWAQIRIIELGSDEQEEEWFHARAPRLELSRAYHMGRVAATINKPREHNPFTPGDAHTCWDTGWLSRQPPSPDDLFSWEQQ